MSDNNPVYYAQFVVVVVVFFVWGVSGVFPYNWPLEILKK